GAHPQRRPALPVPGLVAVRVSGPRDLPDRARLQPPRRRARRRPQPAPGNAVTASAPAAPILEIDRLALSYSARGGVVHAVQDASLVVRNGESVGIAGESGSGKSTLARAVLGLLPERVARISAGRIVVAG